MPDFIIGYNASTLAQKLPAIQLHCFIMWFIIVYKINFTGSFFQLTVGINTGGMRELVIIVSFEMDLGCTGPKPSVSKGIQCL